jgi:hypothetical protein
MRKAVLYPVDVPLTADSSCASRMTRKHSALYLREINQNNTHTALASMSTYYRWVVFEFLHCKSVKDHLKIKLCSLFCGWILVVVRSTYEQWSQEMSCGILCLTHRTFHTCRVWPFPNWSKITTLCTVSVYYLASGSIPVFYIWPYSPLDRSTHISHNKTSYCEWTCSMILLEWMIRCQCVQEV